MPVNNTSSENLFLPYSKLKSSCNFCKNARRFFLKKKNIFIKSVNNSILRNKETIYQFVIV